MSSNIIFNNEPFQNIELLECGHICSDKPSFHATFEKEKTCSLCGDIVVIESIHNSLVNEVNSDIRKMAKTCGDLYQKKIKSEEKLNAISDTCNLNEKSRKEDYSALTFNQKILPQLSPAQCPDAQKVFAERITVAEKLLDRRVQYEALGLKEKAEKLNLDRTVVYWLLVYYSRVAESREENAKMLRQDATRIFEDPAYGQRLAILLREGYAKDFVEEVLSTTEVTDIIGVTTYFQQLEAQLCSEGQRLIRIIPDLSVLIIEDIITKRHFEIPAETLKGEAKEIYSKTAFLTKCLESPAYGSRFKDGKHFNIAGSMLKPRISINPDPRVFISENLPDLLQGRTDVQKKAILERFFPIFIYVVGKTADYKMRIDTVQDKIKQTENPGEKQKLQHDLVKLQKRYNELQEIDPNILYWLAVFCDDGSEKRAEALQEAVKAATGNELLAAELALVLVEGRLAQRDFCFRNGIEVKNTEFLHTTFWQIAEKNVPEEGCDMYETRFVRNEIRALNQRIELEVQKLQKRMQNKNLIATRKTDLCYFMSIASQNYNFSALKFNQKILSHLVSVQCPDLQKAFAKRVAIAEKLLDRRVQYQALGLEEEADKLNLDYIMVYWLLVYHISSTENVEENVQKLEKDATRIIKDPAYTKLLVNLLREGYAQELIQEVFSITEGTDPQAIGEAKAARYDKHKDEVLSIERGAYQSSVNILIHGQIPGYTTVLDCINKKYSALTFNEKVLSQLICVSSKITKKLAAYVGVAEKLLDRRAQYEALGLKEEAEKLNLDPAVVYWLLIYHSSYAHSIEDNARFLEEDATRILKDPAYAKMLASLLRARYAEDLIQEVLSITAKTNPQTVGEVKAAGYDKHKDEVLLIERSAYQSAVSILIHGRISGYTGIVYTGGNPLTMEILSLLGLMKTEIIFRP